MSKNENMEVSGEDNDIRLDRWFARHFPHLKFAQIQKLVRTGQVRVDGKRAKANQRLEAGQIIRVPPISDAPVEKKKSAPDPHDVKEMRQMVIYEDQHIIALNKPPGIAVQGGSKVDRHIDGLLDTLAGDGDRPRLVHRLDRDTSGVLLLARSASVAATLGKAFQGRDMRKYYWAVTVGVPAHEGGKIDTLLAKMGGRGDERMGVTKDRGEGKRAVTLFQVLESVGKNAALVAFWPRTGRTHQLRVHATVLETPILGDFKYGGENARLSGVETGKGLHLHAWRLIFKHPVTGKKMDIIAPPSSEMKKTFSTLGLYPSGKDDPFSDIE